MRRYCYIIIANLSLLAISCGTSTREEGEVAREHQAIWNGTGIPASPEAVGIVRTTVLGSGLMASGSGIALNNRWILTAKHVREKAHVDFMTGVKNIKVDLGPTTYDVEEVSILGNGPMNWSDRKYDLEAYRTTNPMSINGSTTGWRTQIFQGTTADILTLPLVTCWGYGNGGSSGSAGTLRFAQLPTNGDPLTGVVFKDEPTVPFTMQPPVNFFTLPNSLNQQLAEGDSGGPCFDGGTGKLVGIVRAVVDSATGPSPKGVVTSVQAYDALRGDMRRLAMVDPEQAYFADVDGDGNPDLTMVVAKDDGFGGQYIDLQMQFSSNVPFATDGFVDFDDLNVLGVHLPTTLLPSTVAALGDFNGNGTADVLAFVGNVPLYYDGLQGLAPIVHTDLSSACLGGDLSQCMSLFTPPTSLTSYKSLRSTDLNGDGYQDVEALTPEGFVDTYYGSEHGLISSTQMDGLPTADASDGKFLGLSGRGLSTIDRPAVSVWISVPSGQTDLAVEVFDGDLGGNFDDVLASGVHVCYQLTSDPEKKGAPVTNESKQKTDVDFPDNAWGTLYHGPVFGTPAAGGARVYRLDAFIGSSCASGADATQPIYNDFKVRANGTVSVVYGELSFEGEDAYGPYSTIVPNLTLPDTNYDGTFDFYPYVGTAASEVIFTDADADYYYDDVPGRTTNQNKQISYTVYDPYGLAPRGQANPNTDPSGNYDVLVNQLDMETNTFTNPAAGVWHWHWDNVMISNNVHISAPYASPTTYEMMASARKPLFVSSALTPVAWRSQLTTVSSTFPIVLGSVNGAGQPVSSSVVVTNASEADGILAADQGTLRQRLAATLLGAKLNVARAATRGERLTNGTVYGTLRAVKDVLSDGDYAMANRQDQTDPTGTTTLVSQLRAIDLAEISYRPIPSVASGGLQADDDGDGIVNATDNCPVVANADQRDIDANGTGDVCQCQTLASNPPANGILELQYKNGALSPTDNTIRPQFKLSNTGTADISLADVTVRYWYTNEQTRDQQYLVDYAQLGAANVRGTFSQPFILGDKANSYFQIGFTAAAGTLRRGQSTGEIQTRFSPVDWSNYNEVNDYSYDPSSTTYSNWERMTVYIRGLLVWGREPIPAFCSGGPLTRPQVFSVEYQQGDVGGAQNNVIKPYLRIVNSGPADVPLSELTLRYWYTEEGSSIPEATYVDSAAFGIQNVGLRTVPLATARSGADHYLEVSFNAQAGSLLSGANTGNIFVRFSKTDWSNYDETNDYSYNASQTSFASTTKVTLYRNGALIAGVEP